MFKRLFKKKKNALIDAVNKPSGGTTTKKMCLTINPPEVAEEYKTIVVLGVERGGTSMAAGIIRALSVDMGQRAGLNHEDPRFITEDEGKLEKLIKQRNKEANIWGFKMPKAVNKLDFFEKHLRNPYFIVIHRNLAAVADSWSQRGAGQYLDVIDRALNYHHFIIEHLRVSTRPALILNYERSVTAKYETVQEIAGFLGLHVDEQMIQRAVSMITGDGKGYVNLPEHFFNITPCQSIPNRPLIPVIDNSAEIVDEDGWITFKNFKKKQVLRPAMGGMLPKKFWLFLEFDAPETMNLADLPLRIYFDFIGEMFPGHCCRPIIVRQANYYFVETSGQAAAIGFGPLHAGVKLKLHPMLHEASSDDTHLRGMSPIS